MPDPVATTSGDVLARFQVRAEEFRNSVRHLAELAAVIERPASPQAGGLPGGTRAGGSAAGGSAAGAAGRAGAAGAASSGVGIAEGWRGTIVHRVQLARDGRLDRVRVVDPSFFNWPALPVALTGAIVPDFPLANKSFNLSYAGNDL